MVDIFDEVNEDLRAERAKNMMMRYGGVIIAGCIAVVAAVGGWQTWNWWKAKQDAAAAMEFVAAMNRTEATPLAGAGDQTAAIAVFEALSTSAPDGYRTLSRLQAAALKARSGDVPGALALWDQVAADTAADPLMRDLASLLWAERQLDSGDPALLEARLKPMIQPGNVWRSLAREQLALLDLRQGREEVAKTAFRALAEDVTAPAGVRGRSNVILGRLGG